MYYVIASILLNVKMHTSISDNHQIPWYLVLYSGLATAKTVTCMARTEGIQHRTCMLLWPICVSSHDGLESKI